MQTEASGELAPELSASLDRARHNAERLERLFARLLDGDGGGLRARLASTTEARLTREDTRWLERVRQAIEDGIEEETFSVEALADKLAVHRSRLHQRLRELTGLPPVKLIVRCRLERAAALLANGSASVSEAAYAVGFQSVEHFSRTFRKHYGQAPSTYRSSAPDRRST